MIVASHSLIYSDDAPASRAFFRDVLRLPFVHEQPPGDPDWLIFASGPSEFGIHPTRGAEGRQWATAGDHQLCFVVDDIDATTAELESRGAVFEGGVTDDSFGRTAILRVPGAGTAMLYEATHTTAYDRWSAPDA